MTTQSPSTPPPTCPISNNEKEAKDKKEDNSYHAWNKIKSDNTKLKKRMKILEDELNVAKSRTSIMISED